MWRGVSLEHHIWTVQSILSTCADETTYCDVGKFGDAGGSFWEALSFFGTTFFSLSRTSPRLAALLSIVSAGRAFGGAF